MEEDLIKKEIWENSLFYGTHNQKEFNQTAQN